MAKPAGTPKRAYVITARVTLIAVSLSFLLTYLTTNILQIKSIDYGTLLMLSVLVPLLLVPLSLQVLFRTRAQLEETRERLNRLSDTDELTGLFNRRHFFELAHRELLLASRYNFPVALLLIDIDHFKRINESFGYVFGDHALRNCGKLIKELLRETDILARFGGEEFVILMPHTEKEQMLVVAERVREALAKMVLFPDDQHEDKVIVTVSIGMAATTETPMLTDLVTRAEAALFRAKYTGGNRIEEERPEAKPTIHYFERDE